MLASSASAPFLLNDMTSPIMRRLMRAFQQYSNSYLNEIKRALLPYNEFAVPRKLVDIIAKKSTNHNWGAEVNNKSILT